MSGVREPDTIVASWLDDGPTDLPADLQRSILIAARTMPQARSRADRLARRIEMSRFQTLGLVAAVAIVAVVGVVALAAFRGDAPGVGGLPTSTPAPTPSQGAFAPTLPLSDSFVSPAYGYSLATPADWTIDTGHQAWTGDGLPGDTRASEDFIHQGEDNVFVVGSSQPLDGQTFEAWSSGILSQPEWGDSCPVTTEPIAIDAQAGTLVSHCPDVGVQTALVALDGRGYYFVAYELPSIEDFKAILASVKLNPAAAAAADDFAIPALTQTYTSPTYGFTIDYPADWEATAATEPYQALDFTTAEGPSEWLDVLHPLGGNGLLRIASARIPDGSTADAVKFAFWGVQNDLESVTIAGQPAQLRVDGGEIEATLVIGDRVYLMTLFQGTGGGQAIINPRGVFDAMTASLELRPDDAVDPPAASPAP